MKMKITISLKGLVRQDDVAQGYVTFCPALKIYAHGKTTEEAMACMEKTMILYIETCLQRGILDEVLRKAGFSPATGYPAAIPVEELAQEYISIMQLQEKKYDQAFDIEVPIHLIAQAQAVSACHNA
jgi:predicted RNase H-like HicB family nuclease